MKKSMKNENEELKKTGRLRSRLRSMRKTKKSEQENERESARQRSAGKKDMTLRCQFYYVYFSAYLQYIT